jgi:hypothetical protein
MLKRVTIRNFQAHRKATFDLERIVTFVGENDAGKSAIVRTMFWVAFNQPPGDEIINWHADSVSAKLEFDDCEVVRKKGKNNLYLVNGERFKSFGAGKVPDTVAKAIRMDEINVQQQLDAHFWFSDTAGTVSKQLNRVVDLSIIDSSLAASEATHKRAKRETEICRKHLKESQAASKEMSWVPTFLEQTGLLRTLSKQREDLESECRTLSELLRKHNDAEETERKAAQKAALAQDLLKHIKAHDEQSVWCASLDACLQSIDELDTSAARRVAPLPEIRVELSRHAQLEAEIGQLVYLVKALETEERKRWDAEKSLIKIRRVIFAETKDRCPLCGKADPRTR